MLLSPDTMPQNNLYYLGGKVIQILKESMDPEMDFLYIYQKLLDNHSISIPLFIKVLDWLFLIGTIQNGKQGGIVRCF